MVFQHFNLFPHMTILDNMTLAPVKLLKQMPQARLKRKAHGRCCARVGLARPARTPTPAQLSGGQKQRVAIVRALCNGARRHAL